jgi:HK97 gp10 family phage protein
MAKKGLKIDFSDIRKFETNLRKGIKSSESNLKTALFKAVTLIHREAVNNTQAGVKYADGIYERGNLRRSLTFDIPSPRYGEVFISKGLKYPLFVEMGTRRMRAKPFLSLAVRDNIEKVNKIFGEAVKKTINNLKL